ncbi:hypothetical protein ABPG72_020542 [Tetrahymena utriculariae]
MEIKSDLENFDQTEQLSQKFKYKVFFVMDKMIDFYHNSFLIEIMFLAIQTFQLIGLLDFEWMRISKVTNVILDFMQSFLFVPFFLDNNQASQFQVLFYFCSIYIFMVIMCFLSTSIMIEQIEQISEKQKSSYKILFSILDFLVNTMNQVLYIPFFQLFCSSFRCEKNINNDYSALNSQNSYFNTITKNECFATIQIPNFLLSIICMVLLHGFSSFFNKLYFDSRLDCTYKNSKINGKYDLNVQYFASTFSVITTFVFEERYSVIRVILSITWWFNLVKLLNENILYNYKIFSFLKLQQALIIFWTSLIGAYNYFFPGSTIVVFYWVVGIIFLTIYNIHYEPVNNEICAANSSNYMYANDAIKQLRVLCYAITRYDQYSLKIDGFLNRHRNDCNLPNCPSRSNSLRIKKFNRMLASQTNNEDLIMSIFVTYTIFNNNIQKFGGSNQIRLLYSLFLLDTIQNKDQALIQISFLLINQPSLQEQFFAYRLKKVIMQIQNHKDYKKLDFSSELNIDEYSNKFKKLLNTAIQNYIQFLQELLENSPQAENLLKKGNQLNEQFELIQNQFDHLSQQKNLNQHTFHCYKIFSINVLEDKEHFQALQKQIIDQNEQQGGKEAEEEGNIQEDEIYTQGIVVISSQEENFANIIEVNSELLKIIGFTKSQVLLKNISFLIPKIWQQYHDQFIDLFLASGQKKIIGQQRDMFIKCRQDYSLPIKINIKTIPSHSQGLLFQAQIIAQNLLYDYPAFIITQVNGKIDTISHSVIPMFNIDMKKVKQGMFIEKIIPNFWEFFLDFQQKQGKELYIKTYQQKMMKESKVRISVEQIRFMNLGSQGYIICIKQSKSEIKNFSTMMRKNKKELAENQKQLASLPQFQTTPNKECIESAKDQFKEDNFENDNTTVQINANSVCNTNQSNFTQKLINQVELFYDMRTNSYQGAMITVSKSSNYIEIDQDVNFKQKQKSIFSQASPKYKSQYPTSNIQNEKCQKNQILYPFIYTQIRSQEERVRDILDNNQSVKKKNLQVENKVEQILGNLIKMQCGKSSTNHKLSQKSTKKSKEVEKNGDNILPPVYIKSYEIEVAQKEFINHIEFQILEKEQNKEKLKQENETNYSNKFQKDYGENIKTFRLEQNKLIDLKLINEEDQQNSENSDQDLENCQKILQDENLEGDYSKELDEIVHSKKNIKSFMKDTNFNVNSSFFTCKKIFSLFFLVFEIVYIILSQQFYQQQVNNTIIRFQMYNATHLFYANTQHIIEVIFNMFAIDKGVNYNIDILDQSTSQFYFQKYLEAVTVYQFGLDEILTKLYLNKVGVTQKMEELFISDQNIIIFIHFTHRKPVIYPMGLYQATQQVMAKGYHFKRIPLGQFDIHNHDILTHLENLSNQFLNKIIIYRDLQEQEIFSYFSLLSAYQQNILFAGLIFILSYLIIFCILYLKTLFCLNEVPSLLTTIPLSQIRNQIKIYDQTLSNNYVGVRQVYEPIVYFKQNINQMYDLLENFTYTHYNNYNYLPNSYRDQFDEYFSKNTEICTQLQRKYPYYVNVTECNSLMNGQLKEGMNINIEHLIQTMISYSQTIVLGNIALPFKHSVNPMMYEVQQITNYLKFIMRELNDLLIVGLISNSKMEIKSDLEHFEDSEYVSQKYKYKVFYLVDKMIDFHHNSFLIESIFLIIQTLQLIGLLDQSWMHNSSITDYILYLMQRFLFVPFLMNNGYTSQYQQLFYFSSSFIIILIMGFASSSLLIEKNEGVNQKLKSSHKMLFSALDFTVNTLTQVLYIPFFQLFASTFQCEKNSNYKYSSTQSQEAYFDIVTKDECFSVIKISSIILSIVCMMLLHGFCSYINRIYYDSRLDCTYKNSKLSGEYEQNIQYFVTTYCIIASLLFEEKYQCVKIIMSVVWWFYLLKLLLNNMLHNFNVLQKIKLEQVLMIFWTTLIGVYNYFFPGSTIVAFFWIVGIIFLTIFNIYYESVTNEICAANSFNYKYVQDALQHLRVLCYAIQKYDQYSIKVDGFLNRHRNDCDEPACPSRCNSVSIKKISRMLINQITNEDLIMSISVIYTIFNSNIQKFGGSNKIRILYALFLFETIQNKDQSLIQLSFVSQNQPTLEEEFMSYRLRKIIIQLSNLNECKKLDFSSELSIEEYSNKFKKTLNTTMQNYLKFWQELLEQSPQAQNLLMKGSYVLQQSEAIKSQFGQLKQQVSINQSAFRYFQNFCLNFLEDQELFQILQRQDQDQNYGIEDDKQNFIQEEETYTQGIIVISSQEESFASIIEINSEMLKIIGFPKSQVMSKNVSFLIPSIWQKHHNQFIDQFLATGKKRLIGQKQDLFIKSRQDYSIPISLVLKIIPSHTQGLLFQASINAQNLLYDNRTFIITQVNGQIETISPSAIAMFNIDMKKIKQGMYIEKIIPNFWEYIFEFQQKQGKELTLKTFQMKMMKEAEVKINVEQIRFLNLGSQGYIINVRLSKSEFKSQQSIQLTKSYDQNFQKKQPAFSKLNNDKQINLCKFEDVNPSNLNQFSFQNEDSFLKQNNNYSFESKSKRINSSIQKQSNQMEIFYDMRTNSYLGTLVAVQNQNYHEDELETFSKKLQKSKFSQNQTNRLKQTSAFSSQSQRSQYGCNLYPYIYSSERNQEEWIQDILESKKNQKQKRDVADSEVQKILENLIKMQYNKSKKQEKLSSKSQKKSEQLDKIEVKTIPQVYLKHYEIFPSQEEYKNHLERQIFNKRQKGSNIHDDKGQLSVKIQKNYGENIKTLRLEENKMIDIKLSNENEELDSENSNSNIENNQQVQQFESTEAEYQKEIDEIVGSKKNIKSFMKDSNFNKNSSLFNYKNLFSFLFLVFEIVYISLSLVLYEQQVNNSITRFKMYNVTHLYFANTQHIIEGAFNMFAIDKGSYYNYDNLDYQTSEYFFQKYLEQETIYQFDLDEILTQLYLNKVGVTQQMQDLFINNRNMDLLIHFNHHQTYVYPNNLYQASQQVLAKVYHFKRVPLGKFDLHNNDIFINLENFSNQLLNQIIQYRDLQEQEISSYLNSVQTYLKDILFIALIFMLAYFVLVSVLYLKTLFYYYEVPSILTTIPLSQIRLQVKRCEQFLNNSQNEDEEENNSNELLQEQNIQSQPNKLGSPDQIIQNENQHNLNQNSNLEDSNNVQSESTNLQQKNENHPQKQEDSNREAVFSLRGATSQNFRPIKYNLLNILLILPFFFQIVLFSVFISVDTRLTQHFTDLLQGFYQELTYSVKLEPNFILLFNCLKSQTIANNYIGVRQVYEPLEYFTQNINQMYDLMDNLTQIHYYNFNNLPPSYQSQFDLYFSQNPSICGQLHSKYPQSTNLTECSKFLYGKFNEGMNINIAHLITQMIEYSQSMSKDKIQLPYKQSMNSQMYDIQLICTYLQLIMRELNNLFVSGIQLLFNNLNVARLAFSIIICSLLFCIFLFVSIPIIQKIKNEIFSQRLLFYLLPKSLISQNRHIRQYLLKQYLSCSKK